MNPNFNNQNNPYIPLNVPSFDPRAGMGGAPSAQTPSYGSGGLPYNAEVMGANQYHQGYQTGQQYPSSNIQSTLYSTPQGHQSSSNRTNSDTYTSTPDDRSQQDDATSAMSFVSITIQNIIV